MVAKMPLGSTAPDGDGADEALWHSARRIHVVGVGGYGTRGLARLIRSLGVRVTGSDREASDVLAALETEGIPCWSGHDPSRLPADLDLVVISAAVPESDPEVAEARSRGIPVWKYARCLGQVAGHREVIAVGGTHGKTTTAAMLAWILSEAGFDPGFLFGGVFPMLGGSAGLGSGPFVVEACEYDRSFHHIAPMNAVVTNIEPEHLDCYGSFDAVLEGFWRFIGGLPPDGTLVIGEGSARSLADFGDLPCRVETFGHDHGNGADWVLREVVSDPGGVRGIGFHRSGWSIPLRLRVPGVHNLLDALAASVMALGLGAEPPAIRTALEGFAGVKRRFEVLHRGRISVVDDYAHHPSEVHAVLAAARHYFPGSRLRAVFQPHQPHRFQSFFPQFAKVLEGADEVIVTDIHTARGDGVCVGATPSDLVRVLRENGRESSYVPDLDELPGVICRGSVAGDVVIALGAGSITRFAHELARRLEEERGSGAPVCRLQRT